MSEAEPVKDTGPKDAAKKHAAKSSKKARSTAARLFAVQAVYQALQLKVPPASLLEEYTQHRIGMDLEGGDADIIQPMVQPDGVLFIGILKGVTDRWSDLQGLIMPRLSNPSIESLLTAILVCGTYELLTHHEVDAPIVIADYLHVTHGFFAGSESKLVNGVLDALAKELRS